MYNLTDQYYILWFAVAIKDTFIAWQQKFALILHYLWTRKITYLGFHTYPHNEKVFKLVSPKSNANRSWYKQSWLSLHYPHLFCVWIKRRKIVVLTELVVLSSFVCVWIFVYTPFPFVMQIMHTVCTCSRKIIKSMFYLISSSLLYNMQNFLDWSWFFSNNLVITAFKFIKIRNY